MYFETLYFSLVAYIFHPRANKERDGLIPQSLSIKHFYTGRPVRSTAYSTEWASWWCWDGRNPRHCSANCKRTDRTYCFPAAAFRTINL